MARTGLTTTDVISLILKVDRDTGLPRPVRRRASQIRARAGTPELAYGDLLKLADDYLPRLPLTRPEVDLVRVVAPSNFLSFHVDVERQGAFEVTEDLQRFIEGMPTSSRGAALEGLLSSDPVLFPSRYSWLGEWRSLLGLSGQEIRRVLELRPPPPYIVFRLAEEQLHQASVGVRVPCSLDAVYGPNLHWREGGPASGLREYVDSDVPLAALTAIEWRP